ncbi:MAG: SDR family oxidoreductase [bacterium]|nr:SDR family oxidoreductase [Candidatus Kapabacteria bacterium]
MSEHNRRSALITGASRGFGRAIAEALAHEGWDLIIDARGAEALDATRDALTQTSRVIAIAGDIGDAHHRDALAEAAREIGGLDAIINNAGTLGTSPLPPLLEYSIDELRDVFVINTIAPLALLQQLRDTLRDNATVINVTSDAAVEAYPGWGGYGASKAALEAITRVLAAENPSLRVYALDPGDMRTTMHQDAFPGEDISDRPEPELSVPAVIALLNSDAPSGRYRASEVASEAHA